MFEQPLQHEKNDFVDYKSLVGEQDGNQELQFEK